MKKTLALLALFSFACQSNKSIKSPSDSSDSKQDVVEQSIKMVEKEDPESLEKSYSDLRLALTEYKKSPKYKAAKSEEEKNFNTLIDLLTLLKKEDVEDGIKAKKFSNVEKRAKNDRSSISKTANEIIPVSQGLNLAEATEEEKSLYIGSGLALLTLSALTYFNVARGKFGKDLKVLKAIGLSIPLAYPIVVGSLLLAEENPNKATVEATRALLITGAVAASLGTLASFLNSRAAHREMNEMAIGRRGDVYQIRPEDFGRAEEIKGRGAGKLFGFFAAATIGLSVWASEFALSAKETDPTRIVLSKIGRAFIKFRMLESQS